MKLLFRTMVVLLVLCLALPLGTAQAQTAPPYIPQYFSGEVTIGDISAPDNTTVSAEIDDFPYATTTTFTEDGEGGKYLLKVPGEDPAEPGKQGGEPGDIVVFKVNGIPAESDPAGPVIFDPWSDEVPTELDLSIAGTPPVAEFTANPLSGDEPLTVQFTDESLNMVGSPTWAWDFGDEETSTEQNPIHDYLQDGSYTVTLTVTTDGGSDTMVAENLITVTVPGDTTPMVISTSPASGATGVAITATVRATFSKAIDSDTLAFSVSGVSGTITYTGTTATFAPSANLGYSRSYTASVLASDLDGNEMAEAYEWSFTTRAKPATGGGGAAPPTYYTDTNLFGTEESFRISSSGKILETIEATSEDGMLTIAIPKGTIALDKDGKRLKSLEAAVDESPPDPPKDTNIIGLAYDFDPDGATFDPAITLTWSYDHYILPTGVAEKDLVLAYYDEDAGKWVELECVVDTVNNTITASVNHFTTFAVIAVTPPPAPTAPAPAAFSISNLSVQPVEVQPKETVTIAVSVANTGGTEGSYGVILKINGVKEAEKGVTIAAGSSQDISFTVSKEEAASYSVTVDGLSSSFTVVAPPAPAAPEDEEVVPEAPAVPPPAKPAITWPVLGGIIAGVVIVGLLIYFLVRRRAD